MDKKLDNLSLEEMLNTLRELSKELLRLQERVDSLRFGLTDYMVSAASAEAVELEPEPELSAQALNTEPEYEPIEPETVESELESETFEPETVETEQATKTQEPAAEIQESETEQDPAESITLGDRYKRERVEKPLCETIEIHHSADMSKSMSLNDRFLYQRELFGGDAARFYEVMAAIDTFCTYEDAADYVRSSEDWDEGSSAAQNFLEMLQRHFS